MKVRWKCDFLFQNLSILGGLVFLMTASAHAGAGGRRAPTLDQLDALLEPAADPKELISGTDAFLGGMTGTLVGFGMGHAVIAQYEELGYVFTLGEFGTGMIAVLGASGLALVKSTNPPNATDSPLFWVGAASFAAFRIWEIYDIWSRPGRYNAELRKQQEVSDEKISARPRLAPILGLSSSFQPQLGMGLQVRF